MKVYLYSVLFSIQLSVNFVHIGIDFQIEPYVPIHINGCLICLCLLCGFMLLSFLWCCLSLKAS